MIIHPPFIKTLADRFTMLFTGEINYTFLRRYLREMGCTHGEQDEIISKIKQKNFQNKLHLENESDTL